MRIKLANISGPLLEWLAYAECYHKNLFDCPWLQYIRIVLDNSPMCTILYTTHINNWIFYAIVPILLILYLDLAVKVRFSHHLRICRRDGAIRQEIDTFYAQPQLNPSLWVTKKNVPDGHTRSFPEHGIWSSGSLELGLSVLKTFPSS